MSVFKRGGVWWYKFTWRGEQVRESTRQQNKRVAEQMEAARKTAFAKGEVGIEDRKPIPTLATFGEEFLLHVNATFASKDKTRRYYANGVARLLEFEDLSRKSLDSITSDMVSAYVARRQAAGLKVSSINRELQVLRRMFALAVEWGRTNGKALCRVRMVPGETHRDRVLSEAEEFAYLGAATEIGRGLEAAYSAALQGIRAVQRGEVPIQPTDPYLLLHVATILLDCGLRPEECARLKWRDVRDGAIEIQFGKTENARRRIPLPPRSAAVIDMRESNRSAEWVFPASTRSGHIEPCSLKRQHRRACKESGVGLFPVYTFRHTCLTRWAPHMDPWMLAYLAGHADMSTTRRYVHPQEQGIRAAMARAEGARGGHTPKGRFAQAGGTAPLN
jgi:integrase